MKKIILLSFILLLGITYSNAQGYSVSGNTKELEKLKQNGITVVIPDSKFGLVLEKVIKENWTTSKFEFISEKELANYENGKDVFLFGLFRGEVESSKEYIKNTPFIGVVSSYKAKNNYKTKTDACASVVYPGQEIDATNIESSVLLYVKIIQNLINSGGVKKHMAEIKENGKTAIKKPAFVCTGDFKGSITDIKKKYSGKISKVEREIYNQAIINNEDVLISLNVEASNYHLFAIVSNKTGLILAFMFTSTITPKTAKSIQEYTFKRLGTL